MTYSLLKQLKSFQKDCFTVKLGHTLFLHLKNWYGYQSFAQQQPKPWLHPQFNMQVWLGKKYLCSFRKHETENKSTDNKHIIAICFEIIFKYICRDNSDYSLDIFSPIQKLQFILHSNSCQCVTYIVNDGVYINIDEFYKNCQERHLKLSLVNFKISNIHCPFFSLIINILS